jgi:hypothetical protein
MCELKKQIGEWIDIDQGRLNEISLEDVQLTDDAQQCIRRAVDGMLAENDPVVQTNASGPEYSHGIPCKGYWVEGTKELVIYIAMQNVWRTIVIPPEAWIIRDDITVH